MPCLGCWAVISIIAMNIRTSPKMGRVFSQILPVYLPHFGHVDKRHEIYYCVTRQ